ncbi:hypothetical protein CONPUDRAFT_151262 [Coniophora puteana RWD-64-598 SS2]|uniref:ThuA-like domain-containing protein n=1 Tax=Coniophora puteana (strain RWD-64-598) TaxID=741705 RepID=A0A5M3MYL8_CONPW|nr:uncharacterized protein CONPUDRAFT_151262 [Coniophora puteana RWD-64-598 SS2]EIW84230.1 hypothetical protein CONPUDRAFT_151262 [Coniophora puteana RWD-64-598 SS2]
MPANVLLYWATAGYVHDSIPDSREAIKSRPLEVNNIPVVFEDTDDKSWFTDETLEKYDAIVFLNNSGYGILDDTGKAALQKWINLGGNFVGIHCAADALRDTPFFGRQLGAYFHYHPKISEATVKVVDANHPSTKPLPKNGSWTLVDEM